MDYNFFWCYIFYIFVRNIIDSVCVFTDSEIGLFVIFEPQ